MKKFFEVTALFALIFFVVGAALITSASAEMNERGNPICNKHRGDYYSSVDKKCHTAKDRSSLDRIAPGSAEMIRTTKETVRHEESRVIDRDAPKSTSYADRTSDTAQENAFRADCASHNGRVYTGKEWGHGMTDDQLHCHRDASWSVDK